MSEACKKRTITLILATVAFMALLSLISVPLEAQVDIGHYRESFEDAQAELEKINETLASLEQVNSSAVETLRGEVASTKCALNVSDMSVVQEEMAREENMTVDLQRKIALLHSPRGILLGVYGTLGLLTGFWASFLLGTLITAIVKR